MSFLLCPMCGRNVSMDSFDPCSFDLDILAQDLRGLGKGRGFESTNRHSILGDNETVGKIRDRILDLLKLLLDEGIVSEDAIKDRLGFSEETAVEVEEDETQALREETETRETAIDGMVTEIAEALGESAEDYTAEGDDDQGDEHMGRLRYAVGRLIEDYQSSRENQVEA
jgi:hypothetical protein